MLLTSAAIWGTMFVAQRYGSEHLGPLTFNAFRFALASMIMVPVLLFTSNKKGHVVERTTGKHFIGGCLFAGIILFLGMNIQQAGVGYTTAGKAGFITCTYMVIVPLMGLLMRQKIGLGTVVGVALATAGIYFLSVTGKFIIEKGDLLLLISAVFWALHVHIIAWLSVRFDCIRVAFFQFVVCAVLSTAGAILSEDIIIANIQKALVPLIYAGILSTCIGFTLQVIAQRHSPPSHAAVMMSLETIFAALGGYLVLKEVMNSRDILGCGLILSGVLISQLCVRKKSNEIYVNKTSNRHCRDKSD